MASLITDLWQVAWRDVLWGPGTTAEITNLQGWLELPDQRGSNAERPGRHGTYPGQQRSGERVIEVEITAMEDDPTFLATLRAVTALVEDPQEEDLVIWAGTDEPQMVRARLKRRAIPTDHDWSVGHHRATLQWVATDPRRYSATEYTQSIGLPPAPSGGLTWPITFPVTWTDTGIGRGQLTLTNAGDTPTWPVFTLVGPATGPIITNTDTGQQLQFDPDWTLGDGEILVIDTDARAVTFAAGVSRRDRLFVAQWFPFAVGDTHLTFSSVGSYSSAASLSATFRWAWS